MSTLNRFMTFDCAVLATNSVNVKSGQIMKEGDSVVGLKK